MDCIKVQLHWQRGSQYNAGHIIQQGPHSSTRGPWRGSGFELKTDGWGVLRAGLGLFLTSSARVGHGQHIPGTQMDSTEAIGQLKHAAQLAATLSQSAASHRIAAHDPQPWTDYTTSLDQTYSADVNGQSPLKHQAGGRSEGDPVERFNQPVIHLDAPAPAILATPASSLHYAAETHSSVVQHDLQHSAQATHSSVAGGTLSLYNDQARSDHSTGGQALQIKAGNGPVSLQAHTDALRIDADQSLKILSVNDAIHITAQDRIVLTAGDSQIILDGANITFKTPGDFKALSGGQDNAPGQGAGGAAPALPQGRMGEIVDPPWIAISHRDAMGEAFASQAYTLYFKGGNTIKGKLDAQGKARHEPVPPVAERVEYEPRTPDPEKPWEPLANMVAAARSKLA